MRPNAKDGLMRALIDCSIWLVTIDPNSDQADKHVAFALLNAFDTGFFGRLAHSQTILPTNCIIHQV